MAPRIDWNALASYTGYESEKAMWTHMYVDEQKSIAEIAANLDMKHITIRNRLLKCGLILRERGGANAVYSLRRMIFRLDQRIVLWRSLDQVSNLTGLSRNIIKIYRNRVVGEGEHPHAIRSDQSDERLEALFETFKLPSITPPSREP